MPSPLAASIDHELELGWLFNRQVGRFGALENFVGVVGCTGGMVRPKPVAVLKLTTSSNFVGCSTGKSAGLAPFRILSTYPAARRYRSGMLGPYDIKAPTSAVSRNGDISGSLYLRASSAIWFAEDGSEALTLLREKSQTPHLRSAHGRSRRLTAMWKRRARLARKQ